ncbi:nucleoside 2-deoxyribosyltransferase [Staphylococcus phage Stab20]|nr:nucleoside 2-deoxyribosyltransferase [Staphylococcus phage Stab20]
MVNKIKDKVIYMGGHILNDAMVEYRDKQHKQVEGIVGVIPYSPHKDKSINDKANAEQTGLAERILNNDFKAMQESDIFVFDILNEGLGTIAELGILLGMKHQAEETINHIYDNGEGYFNYMSNRFETSLTNEEKLIVDKLENIVNKPVLIYCSDIRQGHGKPYNDPDRAEFSTNQFVYGMVLELTGGEGFISWEEVLERLEKLGEQDG